MILEKGKFRRLGLNQRMQPKPKTQELVWATMWFFNHRGLLAEIRHFV